MPNWNQEQPAPKALRQILKVTFPEIKLNVPDGRGKMMSNYQIYVVRMVANSTTASDHSEGRAMDVYLEASDENEKKIADYLYEVFIKYADDLGLRNVIWNREIWMKSSGQKEKYTGNNPHTNHIHISWSREGSQKVHFGALPARLMLRAGFSGSIYENI